MSYYNVFSIDFIREFKDQIDPECTFQYGKNIPKKFWREMGYDPEYNLKTNDERFIIFKKL